MRYINRNQGFTLVEVVMVIIILGILASIAMKSLDTVLQTTRIEETKRELRMLAIAIAGNAELYSSGLRTDFGYVGDIGNLPTSLDDLVTNPGYSTWNGPYIKSDFTSFSDDFKMDAWGNNYIYTGSNTILSTGGGQDSLRFLLSPGITDFTSNTVTGTVTDALGNPPGDSNVSVQIILSYPNGFGSYKDSVLQPNPSGYFSFVSTVPIGNHTIRVIYQSTNDTVVSFVSVPPKSDVIINLKLPGSLWASSEQEFEQRIFAGYINCPADDRRIARAWRDRTAC